MKRRLLLFVWALSCAQALAQDLTVYTDALASGFQDYSYVVVVDLAATTQVHGGTKSISWQPKNYGALSIARPAPTLSTATYSGLRFWLWCSTDCARPLFLSFDNDATQLVSVSLASLYPGGVLPAQTWTQITVSLDAGSPWALVPNANATFTRFNLQDQANNAPATNTLYVDDIQFIARAVPPPGGPPVLLPPLTPAAAAVPLSFTANNMVNGVSGSQFAWIDSTGNTRSAHMATGTGGANKGGFLNQFVYRLPNNSARTVNPSSPGTGGFGYIVSHLQDAALANNNNEDDSPLGPPQPDNLNGATQTVFAGRHHALHTYTLNYPRWGRNAMMISTKYSMPVTVGWVFATGRNYPLWTVTFDMSQIPPNAVSADTRAPYGNMNFDGAVNEFGDGDVIGGVGWGDVYKFRSTSAALTFNSSWTWNVANTVPHNMLWTQTVDSEMGIVMTQPISQQDAGGYFGQNKWNLTSAAGNACANPATVMSCDYLWPYQSVNYSFYDQNGQFVPNDQTKSKRLAWGANFGYLGQTNYPDRPTGANRSGHPRKSYSTYIVLDTHTRTPTDIQVSQMETRQLSSAAASLGSVATTGPAGLGRPDTINYVPGGFDPIFDAWTFNASGNNATVSFTTPAPYKLHNPLIILRGYTLATEPSQIKIGGVALVADTDFYASAVPSRNELWLTLRGQYQGTTNLEVVGAGAVVNYTVTPSAGANGAIAPAIAQSVASGATTSFTVTPNAGYVASVGGSCGGNLNVASGVYTTAAIVGNCNVAATFALAINSTTAIASSRNPSKAGQSVTFTATVTGNAGTPSGVVVFRDNGNAIAGCAAVALAAGTAQCTTTALSSGARAITAQFTGNGVYGASTSNTLIQTVMPGGIEPVIYLLAD
ncbi:MAG: Ig-like domain repeat protein [Burkholderiales bacterium]|nr:Ig-like domain repeat protein [Burkholderiales bacterium]